MDKIKNYRGEIFIQLLEEAKSYLDNNRPDLASKPLKIFEKEIPEKSDAAIETKTRLDDLYNWYFNNKKYLDEKEKTGKHLEMPDIITAQQQIHLALYWKMYYIFKAVFLKFHLYEDNSVVDYEL